MATSGAAEVFVENAKISNNRLGVGEKKQIITSHEQNIGRIDDGVKNLGLKEYERGIRNGVADGKSDDELSSEADGDDNDEEVAREMRRKTFNGRNEHPSESTNTGNSINLRINVPSTNLPINEPSTIIPNTNNIEETSQEERPPTNNPDVIDSSTDEAFYTPVPDGFDEQDIENSSLLGSTTDVQSSMQDDISSSGEGMSSKLNDDDVIDDEVTIEIRRIRKLPLEDLPGKYEIERELESGSVDTWIRSFPHTFMNDEGNEEKFDLNIENLVALHDAVNGGGNAALTFFAIFQIRKFDKEISYLRDILTKREAKESFINAIKVLEKDEYIGAGKFIGNITSKDINELATQTSGVAADGSRIPQKTWEYIAGESDMQNVVKDCKLSRRRPGYERKSEMLFEIIEQGCPEYKIEDMLKVFETACLRRTVNLVNKKIQEKAKGNISNDQ